MVANNPRFGQTTRMLQSVVEYMRNNPNYPVVVVVSSEQEIVGFRKQLRSLGADMNNIYVEVFDRLLARRLVTKYFWDHRALEELRKNQIEKIDAYIDRYISSSTGDNDDFL